MFDAFKFDPQLTAKQEVDLASIPPLPEPAQQPALQAAPEEGAVPVSFSEMASQRQDRYLSSLQESRGFVLQPPQMGKLVGFDEEEEEVQMTPGGLAQLTIDEGERLAVYKDTKGIPTIGVGFNLQEPANRTLFRQVTGFSAEEAIAGRQITKEHSQQLLVATAARAEKDARSLLPSFDSMPPEVQDAAVNFVFNVGKTTASQFKNTLAAMERGDGAAAAAGIRNSAYYKQVGKRGERVAKALEKLKPSVTPLSQQEEDSGKKAAAAAAAAAGAGMIAARKDPELVTQANKMLKAGSSAEDVYKATGLYYAMDNSWVQMLPDNESRLKMTGGTAKPVRLRDVLHHPQLERLYGDMLDTITVVFDKEAISTGQAVYKPYARTIAVDPGRAPADLLEDILHETQHAMQHWDGRPGGTNIDSPILPNQWAKANMSAGEIKRAKKIGKDLADAFTPMWLDMLEDDRGAIIDALQHGVITDDLVNLATTMEGEAESFDQPLPDKAQAAFDRIKESTHPVASRREMYMRDQGESESRFVERHASKTLDELKALGLPEDNFDRAKALITRTVKEAAKGGLKILK